jgi:hypothetical protein
MIGKIFPISKYLVCAWGVFLIKENRNVYLITIGKRVFIRIYYGINSSRCPLYLRRCLDFCQGRKRYRWRSQKGTAEVVSLVY